MKGKRVVVCTIYGAAAGIVCWLGSYYAGEVPMEFNVGVILAIVLNRAFIGFAIGISAWRVHWALHGVVIGLLGSLPVSVYPLFTPDGFLGFLMYELFGGFWGFFIDLGALAAGARKA